MVLRIILWPVQLLVTGWQEGYQQGQGRRPAPVIARRGDTRHSQTCSDGPHRIYCFSRIAYTAAAPPGI